MFRITDGKGFHITFPNGVTLSTQIGYENYCENYKITEDFEKQINKNDWESKDCEIAIWDKNRWLTNKILNNGDDVEGHVKIDRWLEIFEKCKNYKRVQK
jgi:hypothetical protein